MKKNKHAKKMLAIFSMIKHHNRARKKAREDVFCVPWPSPEALAIWQVEKRAEKRLLYLWGRFLVLHSTISKQLYRDAKKHSA